MSHSTLPDLVAVSSDPTTAEPAAGAASSEGAADAAGLNPASDKTVASGVPDSEPFVSPRDAAETPKLSAKQIAALKSLTNGTSIQDAAFNAHVSRTTVWRWLSEHAAFRAA